MGGEIIIDINLLLLIIIGVVENGRHIIIRSG